MVDCGVWEVIELSGCYCCGGDGIESDPDGLFWSDMEGECADCGCWLSVYVDEDGHVEFCSSEQCESEKRV